MRPTLSVLALAASASAATISIAVGQNSALKFDPDTITAAMGDTLEFHFYSGTGGHSVVSSEFTTPCQPATDAFFSGYIPGNNSGDETFVVNVTSADPIWFYCSLSGHCQEGMVGVVNPPSGKTATDYANAAEVAGPPSAPSSPQGGSLTTLSGSSAAPSSSGGISTNTNARLSSSASSGSASATPSSVSGIGTNTGERLSSTLSESASATMPTTTTGMATNTNTREPTGAAGQSSSSSSSASATTTAKSSAGLGRKERSDVGAAMGLAVFAGGLVALMA